MLQPLPLDWLNPGLRTPWTLSEAHCELLLLRGLAPSKYMQRVRSYSVVSVSIKRGVMLRKLAKENAFIYEMLAINRLRTQAWYNAHGTNCCPNDTSQSFGEIDAQNLLILDCRLLAARSWCNFVSTHSSTLVTGELRLRSIFHH